MTQSPEPTLDELMAQQAANAAQSAAIAKQIATLSIPAVESAIALISSASVAQLVTDATAVRDMLPAGLARANVENVINTLTSVPVNLGVALGDLRRAAAVETATEAAAE